jgi:hypothetical protein
MVNGREHYIAIFATWVNDRGYAVNRLLAVYRTFRMKNSESMLKTHPYGKDFDASSSSLGTTPTYVTELCVTSSRDGF